MNAKQKKTFKIFGISFGIVAFLAFMDLLGMRMFKAVGGFSGEIYSKLEPGYMLQFWTFALGIILFTSITYLLFKKDKSEALSLFVVPIIMLWSGLEDILYYAFGRFQFAGVELPWLNNNLFTYKVAQLMGKDVVTSLTLLVSVIIGLALSYIIYKILERY